MANQPNAYQKFVATAATATLVASAIAPVAMAAPVDSFKDVSKTYKEAVNYLLENNIAQGTTETTFGTSSNISRGDAAVMIAKALKLDTTAAPDAGFQDVNARVAGAVNAIVDAKIASGKTATSFAPADYITRQEMAKMLANAYKLTAKENANFKDVNNNWIGYVSALKEAGITVGKTDTIFAPTANLSRGEFALFMFRAEGAPVVAGDITLSVADSKTFKVAFDKAVDASKVKFEVKKAGVSVNVSKVEFASDNKSATLELSSKLTEGEYTVNVTGAADKTLSATYKATNERVDKIEILSTVAVVDNSAQPTKATLAYKVTNQYGEDISNRTSLTTNDNTNISATAGVVTINLDGQKVGAKIPVTLIDAESAKTATAVVELSAEATVAEVTVDGLYNKDKKELGEDTNLSTDKFYLLVTAKDQYGNVVTDATKVSNGIIASETNPTIVATGTTNNKVPVTKVTIDGKERTAIELTTPAQGLRAGETTVTVISTTTGKNASYTVKVAEATRADVVTLTQPGLVVAGEDTYLPVSVFDKQGNAITDLKILNNANRGVKVTANTTAGEFVTKDGALMVKIPASAMTEGIVSVIAQSATYKVATLTLNANKVATPTVIRGLKDDVSTTIRTSGKFTFATKNLVVEDQYGRVMTTAKLNAALTGTNKIVVKKADSTNKVVTVTDADITGVTDDTATVTPADPAIKGTAKLQFVLVKDNKEVSSSTAEVTVRVTDGSEYASYAANDVSTVYDLKNTTGTGTVASDEYDRSIGVFGVLSDGSKVKLTAGTDFTVTSTNSAVETAFADGVIQAGELTAGAIKYGDNKTEAVATVTVTINATGEKFTKEITFSKVAPKVTNVDVLNNDVATSKLTVKKSSFTYADLLTGTFGLEIEDQYGAVSDNDTTFADGSTIAAPRVTITPAKGTTLKIANNGKENASVTELKTGNVFDVTLAYAGGYTVTVTVSVEL